MARGGAELRLEELLGPLETLGAKEPEDILDLSEKEVEKLCKKPRHDTRAHQIPARGRGDHAPRVASFCAGEADATNGRQSRFG